MIWSKKRILEMEIMENDPHWPLSFFEPFPNENQLNDVIFDMTSLNIFIGPHGLPPVFNVDPDRFRSHDANRMLRDQIIALLNFKFTNRDLRRIFQGDL